MGLQNWLQRTGSRIRSDGWQGVADSSYELYEGAWRTLGWHVPRGTNVYERDWDVLVILDACRVDAMENVADVYDFLGPVDSMTSVGSMSQEWMAKTFVDEYREEMAETAYVSGNVFTEEELDAEDFLLLDEIWQYAWDEEQGIVPPRPITDRAITAGREHDPDRLIVHYMQPHHPFIAEGSTIDGVDADPFGRSGGETEFDALRHGEVSVEEFRAAYEDNLRLVLEDVSLLLSNLDADRVAITADHGDAFGEWGLYDHPAGCLHPSVRNVPWVETTASDEETYEPGVERNAASDVDPTERLRDLGYL